MGAISVPEKGSAEGHTARRVDEQLTIRGRNDVCLRSDGERSIKAIKQEVKDRRAHQTVIPEVTPIGDHAANGATEQAVQTIAGLFRTNKYHLERRLGGRVGSILLIFKWLTEYVATGAPRESTSRDRRTPRERILRRKLHRTLVPFGQMVLCERKLNVSNTRGRWRIGSRSGCSWG